MSETTTKAAQTPMKHTPGPWEIRIATGTCDRHIHGTGMLIATVPYRRSMPEIRTANARLIAAAPDLYEACRAARLQLLQAEPTTEYRLEAIELCNHAIAKAVAE